jgi:enoyl-CoA hydratase/carnithine racemase
MDEQVATSEIPSTIVTILSPYGPLNRNAGRVQLNSPKNLNSLDLHMVRAIGESLVLFAQDESVDFVVLTGSGDRAFCAGGNVKEIVLRVREDASLGAGYAEAFFANEYGTDHAVHEFPKPIVVIGHQIVMGGGIGLMAGADLRVLEENTQLAMPEITIGLYPDVGSTYFLPQLRDRIGLFLGLTGARFNAWDALTLGLIDAVIPDGSRNRLEDALFQQKERVGIEGLREVVRSIGGAFDVQDPKTLTLNPSRLKAISHVTRAPDLLSADQEIRALGDTADAWLKTCAETYARGCPMSAHVFWSMFHFGQTHSLLECFEREFEVSVAMVQEHNFQEGVRALLIDKDQKPMWKPSLLSEVKKPKWLS